VALGRCASADVLRTAPHGVSPWVPPARLPRDRTVGDGRGAAASLSRRPGLRLGQHGRDEDRQCGRLAT